MFYSGETYFDGQRKTKWEYEYTENPDSIKPETNFQLIGDDNSLIAQVFSKLEKGYPIKLNGKNDINITVHMSTCMVIDDVYEYIKSGNDVLVRTHLNDLITALQKQIDETAPSDDKNKMEGYLLRFKKRFKKGEKRGRGEKTRG